MKTKVTDNVVVIPKEFFEKVDEVDIRKEDGVTLVVPIAIEELIWGLKKIRSRAACLIGDMRSPVGG